MRHFIAAVYAVIIAGIVYLALSPRKNDSRYATKDTENVIIRGAHWAISSGTDDKLMDTVGVIGLTDCKDHIIFIHADMVAEVRREAIFHEILHAGTCDEKGNVHNDFFNSPDTIAHDGIYKLAEFMSSVLHENPELTSFLAGK